MKFIVDYLHVDFNIFLMSSWYAEGFYVPPVFRKDWVPLKNFWTYELNCYFIKVDEGCKCGEQEKQWKCKFSNVLLIWYKSKVMKKV